MPAKLNKHEIKVIILCFCPHTTHESHPLDAKIFKSLKQNWNNNACHKFMQKTQAQNTTFNEVQSKMVISHVKTADFKELESILLIMMLIIILKNILFDDGELSFPELACMYAGNVKGCMSAKSSQAQPA